MKIILALLLMFQLRPAVLHETYNNIACFETNDGNLYEAYSDYPETLEVGNYILIFYGDNLVGFVQDVSASCTNYFCAK